MQLKDATLDATCTRREARRDLLIQRQLNSGWKTSEHVSQIFQEGHHLDPGTQSTRMSKYVLFTVPPSCSCLGVRSCAPVLCFQTGGLGEQHDGIRLHYAAGVQNRYLQLESMGNGL